MNKTFGLIKLFAGFAIFMIGFSFIIGGVAIIAVDSIFTDDEGYFETTDFSVTESGISVLRYDIVTDSGPSMKFDLSRIVKFKLELADSSDNAIFVGLISTSTAEVYLSNTSYYYMTHISEMKHEFFDGSANFDYSGVIVASQNITPTIPDSDDWIIGGYETNIIYWEPHANDLTQDLSIIMMMDDSEDLDITFSLGANVPILLPIGIVMLIVGIFSFLISIFIIASGVSSLRKRNEKEIVYYVPASIQTNVDTPKTKVVYVPSTQAPQAPQASTKTTFVNTTPIAAEKLNIDKPKYCPKCGLLNEADSAFCPDCGTIL